jgi:hypothetical protein
MISMLSSSLMFALTRYLVSRSSAVTAVATIRNLAFITPHERKEVQASQENMSMM